MHNAWQLMIDYKIKLQCWYESYVHFFHEQITLIKCFNGCWFTIPYSLSYLLCNIYRFAIQTGFNRRLAIHIRFDKGVNAFILVLAILVTLCTDHRDVVPKNVPDLFSNSFVWEQQVIYMYIHEYVFLLSFNFLFMYTFSIIAVVTENA